MTDPSPLTQTAIYMTGILAGYTLLTTPGEWRQLRHLIRRLFGPKL